MEPRLIDGQSVLVPVVYPAGRTAASASAPSLAGDATLRQGGGVLSGGALTRITAVNIDNRALIAGETLQLHASKQLANLGGTIRGGQVDLSSAGDLVSGAATERVEFSPGQIFTRESLPGRIEGETVRLTAGRFEILLTLVEAYESKHYSMDLPDLVEVIKFRMDQAGLTPKDLVPMTGRLNRVYEILNRKRPLTLNMIWKLHEKLGIPAECLIQPPKANVAA